MRGAAPADPEAAARPYLVAVVTAGAVALATGVVGLALSWQSMLDWRLVGMAVVLGLGAHVVLQNLVLFPWRNHRVALAPDEVLVFLALVTLPPPVVLLFAAPAMAFHGWRTKRPFLKGAFNVSTMLLATSVGIVAFSALTRGLQLNPLAALVPALAAYTIATHWLVAGVFARREGTATLGVFWERFWVPSVVHVVLGVAMGIMVVSLWGFHPLAVAALVPFAYFAREHVKLLAQTDREVEVRRRLADIGHAMAAEPGVDAVAQRVVVACSELLGAGRVALTLHEGSGARPADEAVWTHESEEGPELRKPPLVAPIVAADGGRLGVLRVHPTRRTAETYGRPELHLLRVIAAEAAAALATARALDARARPDASPQRRAPPPPS